MEMHSKASSTPDVQKRSAITSGRLDIDQEFLKESGGILNGLILASAQYLYKVIERNISKDKIQRLDAEKSKRLNRLIIHKDAHLDEYFAELLFRAILPPHLKDLEIKEHTLISKTNDIFAKISWHNAVVFGIGSEDAGGANALRVFDEHGSDGSRVKPSCSQLVADEFLGTVPRSIQLVLNEVNRSDSGTGAHRYNLKNLIPFLHSALFTVGYDEYRQNEISKYLTENWKRALIDACIAAMVFAYETGIFSESGLANHKKLEIENATKKSLDYFVDHSLLTKSDTYQNVKKSLLFEFRVGNHRGIDGAVWRDQHGQETGKQILTLSRICYALEKSWGPKISSFVMMHLWQSIFHGQILFDVISNEIKGLPRDQMVKTSFGSIRRIQIDNPKFKPERKTGDRKTQVFQANSPLWLFEVNLTVPDYFNTATAVKALINDDYSQKGNNGFGLIYLHDKTINARSLHTGPTIPVDAWKVISDSIVAKEPDRWFQLIGGDGSYSAFVINRNKAHQEYLPSAEVDIEFIRHLVE
ncbi:MAG: hypothetical protein JNM55_20950 [Anaerolineales bacterium]|nr:hypothetical protein [Anaerolineales bacterium]